jgi:hypothetical protein
MLRSKCLPILAGAALGIALAATPASADEIMSTLNESNLPGLATGNFGTVDVLFTGPTGCITACTATVTFNAGTGFAFNDSSIADINSTTVNSFAAVNPSTLANGGSKNLDGFGTFSLTTDCTGGCGPNTLRSTVSYDIDGTFTSAAQVLTNNGSGFDAAAHISECTTGTGTTCSNVITTGFAAETVAVPAPSIGHGLPVLLAVGGMLLGFRLWDRRSKRPSLRTT